MRPVLICTKYRGVFFGYVDDDYRCSECENACVKDARMAIYWGTTKGVAELAQTGPTIKTRIGASADVELRKITAVFEVTPEAEAKWIG